MESTYSLADALAGLGKSQLNQNPYAIVGGSLANALTNVIKPQTYTGSPWAAMGAQFGSSLLGSALGQVGQNQVDSRMMGYAKDLAKIRKYEYPDQLNALNANPDYRELIPFFTEQEQRKQAALAQAMMQAPKRSTVMVGDQRVTQEFVPGQGWQTIATAARRLPSVEGGESNQLVGDELVRSALQKARQGETPTSEELEAVSKSPIQIQRIYDQAVYRGGVEDRFNRGFEFKEGQTVVGPYKPVNDSASILTSTEAAKLRGRFQAVKAIELATEQMAKNPQFALTGDEAISNAMYNGLLMNTFRNATNSGANFTAIEQELIKSQILPTLTGGRTLGALLMELTGRDRQSMANLVIKALNAGFDAEMAAIGHVRPGGYYDDKQKTFLKQSYGYSPVGEAAQTTNGVPKRQAGETPQQYLQRIGAK